MWLKPYRSASRSHIPLVTSHRRPRVNSLCVCGVPKTGLSHVMGVVKRERVNNWKWKRAQRGNLKSQHIAKRVISHHMESTLFICTVWILRCLCLEGSISEEKLLYLKQETTQNLLVDILALEKLKGYVKCIRKL